MKITNNFDLPEAFSRALEKKTAAYDSGNVNRSATQLINAPRIDILRKEYYSELEKDLSEEMMALLGNGVHHILEEGAEEHVLCEERLYGALAGWTFSGAIDAQHFNADDTISIDDYKVTTSFSLTKDQGEPKPDWVKQLNIYGWLIRHNKGKDIKNLRIIAVIRDWSRSKAQRDELYPQAPVVTVNLPVWSQAEAEQYIIDRIHEHQKAELLFESGYELPFCSPQDQWENGAKWAVQKKNAKRAKSIHPTKEEAEEILSTHDDPSLEIIYRPGTKSRCAGDWCQVSRWCTQWQTEQALKELKNEE